MTDHETTIAAYADAFERRLAGPARERSRARAELVDHLSDAAAAGELDQTLRRLGDPAAAARAFAHDHPAPPAAGGRRLAAALLDNLPLAGVTVALLIHQLVRLAGPDEWTMGLAFPPFLVVEVGGVCVGTLPFTCEADPYQGAGLLYGVGVPIALAWSVLGLGMLESRTGTTPGKRLCGLKVVTTEGLRIPMWAGILRRIGLLLGPLVWLDWLPVLCAQPRRVLEQAAGTKVVACGGGEAHR
ncbi:RDD family protein [Thermomonospora echinospora]|uniref:RDD family protein n=1 Tax=Thermomonospora echinospora TaxID=1992 RepID=A0A1H6CTT3_9ACTN|nr:RDD family protein [Thermomonospora echinospora]SEG76227.1 RDD family protein [Thermomonospora echinospora]